MDLRVYYQKIRDAEAKIPDAFPVLVSQETADGGKFGTRTEVPRRIAARMIVDGRARLADADEAREFQREVAAAKKKADEEAAAAKIAVTLVRTDELQQLRGKARPS